MNQAPSSSAFLKSIAVGLAVAATACAGPESVESRTETMSEIAAATVSSAARSGGSGSMAYDRVSAGRKAFSCPVPSLASQGSGCFVDESGRFMTLSYEGCNFGNNSAVWHGTEILEFNSEVSCGSPLPSSQGVSLVRTYGEGSYRQRGNSVHFTHIDTASPSGYSVPVSGGTEVVFGAEKSRMITIKGLHLMATKEFRGNGNEGRIETLWDKTVSTEAAEPLEVVVSGDARTVTGTIVVQNNLEKFTGKSEFDSVVFSGDSSCCHPVSGTITTEFFGSRTGVEKLTFSDSGCGEAKIENEGGGKTEILLDHCF